MRLRLSVAILALLCACNRPSGSAPLAGRYVLDRGVAQDTLVLLPDGRYLHSTAFEAHALLTDSGTWRMTAVDGQQRLQINHWVLWALPDSNREMLNADAGTWYARIDTLPDGTLSLPLGQGLSGAFVAIH
ncbi:MAG: hypothetical protein ABI742_11860 [Gemmatimonadota bacterium]